MKGQFITKEVRNALHKLYNEDKLTQEKIGQLAGVNRSSVNGWLNGESQVIRENNWNKLYPHLKKYLPAMWVGNNSLAVNGAVNNSSVWNSSGGDDVEKLKRKIQDAIMDSDLDDNAKVKAFSIIRQVGPEK